MLSIPAVPFVNRIATLAATAAVSLTLFACDFDAPPAGALQTATSPLKAADCPAGSNVILGTAGRDLIVGTPGDDCILGLDGDDELDGAGGNDTLAGGNGDDRLAGGDGDDVIYGDNGDDDLAGGPGNDTLIGGNGRDTLDGGDDNDILAGERGPDELGGGDGNDVIIGGQGADSEAGGDGRDACDGDCEDPTPRASGCGACSAEQTCVEPLGLCIYCIADGECDDGNSCTTAVCEPAAGCTNPALADGTSCADADVCNGAETCAAGACAAGEPLRCDDGDACTADSCDAAAGCGHATISCDDADPCTADRCDAETGCVHLPIDTDADGVADCAETPPADLAILQPYSVDGAFRGVFYEVARNTGDATFAAPTSFAQVASLLPNGGAWMSWNEYELADVDGDGFDDLVILQPYSVDGAYRGVFYEVCAGRGDGGFDAPERFDSVAAFFPNGPDWMTWTDYSMADVNGDGYEDLAIVQPYSVDGAFRGVIVELALGDGSGNFGPVTGYATVASLLSNGGAWMDWNEYALAHIDGDGFADLVILQPYSVDGAYRGVFYEVAYGNGDGSFAPPAAFAAVSTGLPNGGEWMSWTDYGLADTTGDGLAELAILQPYSVDGAFRGVFYEIARNLGDGSFGAVSPFAAVSTLLPNGSAWMEWNHFELGRAAP
jgi:Ca2+-binding RTX toxin-like protein